MRHILTVGDIPLDTPLLEGIDEADRARTLAMLRARYIAYDAGDLIRDSDPERRCAAYLVEGYADGYVYDENGNRSILHLFCPGQVISCGKTLGDQPVPTYDVVAREECRVLTFTTDYVPITPGRGRAWTEAIKDNLARSVAALSSELMATLDIRLRRTIRGKVMAYLNHEAKRLGTRRFTVPYNRQELADYLCVDRSALSRELSSLHEDGAIDFYRNNFVLK